MYYQIYYSFNYSYFGELNFMVQDFKSFLHSSTTILNLKFTSVTKEIQFSHIDFLVGLYRTSMEIHKFYHTEAQTGPLYRILPYITIRMATLARGAEPQAPELQQWVSDLLASLLPAGRWDSSPSA
jgi:hypothetical protein